MICAHCGTSFEGEQEHVILGDDEDGQWRLYWKKCPNCHKVSASLSCFVRNDRGSQYSVKFSNLVHPRLFARNLSFDLVPDPLRSDYFDAVTASPKGKAALCRRCLQIILRESAKVKPGTLDSEIDQILESGKLPISLAKSIDAIRTVGNLAAHPVKDKATGETLEVDWLEANWLLQIVEELLYFYFMTDPELDKKLNALNAKLATAGKPALKLQ